MTDPTAPIETIYQGVAIQDHGAGGVRIAQPDQSFVRFDSVEEARRWVEREAQSER